MHVKGQEQTREWYSVAKGYPKTVGERSYFWNKIINIYVNYVNY